MSVLIKGMEMPDYGYVCLKVFANGEVLMTKEVRGALVITGIRDKVGTAVPVPEHGRLIDADALINALQELFDKRAMEAEFSGNRGACVTWNDAIYHIKSAPTIIPAEEGK